MSYITDGHLVEIASGAERINTTLERIATALETLVEQGKPTAITFNTTNAVPPEAEQMPEWEREWERELLGATREPEPEAVFIDADDYWDSEDLFGYHLVKEDVDGRHDADFNGFDGFYQLNEAGLALLGEFHDPEPVVESDKTDYDSMVLIHQDDLGALEDSLGCRVIAYIDYDIEAETYRVLKPKAVAAMGEFYPEVLEGAEAYGAAPVGTLVRGIGHDLRKMNSTHWLDLYSTGESYHSTHLSASRKVLYWGAAA